MRSSPGLRFSLAGVQLKFSMREDERGLTLPMKDELGDWIVKLPDVRYPRVPENEYSMLSWARASGIDVPEAKLIPVMSLRGLPENVTRAGGMALAVRRFDRRREHDGRMTRIHQEDFAQTLNLYPDSKYKAYNYETIAKIIHSEVGAEAFWEFVKWVIFVVLTGNADAHHKNWSLRYPDGRRAELAPAYDQVATILYPELERTLAFKLAKTRDFASISVDGFVRMAAKVGADDRDMVRWARECVATLQGAWHTVRVDIPLDAQDKAAIEAHWKQVPMTAGLLPR